jgi:hypothetical protein
MEKEVKKQDQKELSIFDKLKKINVNDKVSVRGDKTKLTYLSWADALDYLYSEYGDDDVSYIIHENESLDNLPIFGNGKIGYYVKTNITICGITKSMSLPVLNHQNNTMLDENYQIKTKYGTQEVEPINMFAINKAVMRCLVKNIAVFGLGLYIYQGEDLPDEEAKEVITKNKELLNKIKIIKDIANRNKDAIIKINENAYKYMISIDKDTEKLEDAITRAFNFFATNNLK